MKAVTMSLPGFVLAVLLSGPLRAQEKERPPPRPTPSRTEKAMKLARVGDELALEGKTTKAMEKYRQVVELLPSWTKARFRLGRLGFARGQGHYIAHLDAARRAGEALQGGDPEEAGKLQKESELQRKAADPLLEEAVANLRIVAAAKALPRLQVEASLLLGHASAMFEKWQEAKDHYLKAQEIHEKDLGTEPGDPGLKKIRQAVKLMDEEVKKQKARKRETGEEGADEKGTEEKETNTEGARQERPRDPRS